MRVIVTGSSGFVGNEIEAPFAGVNSFGAAFQTFLNECLTHFETEPFLRIPRTRHQ